MRFYKINQKVKTCISVLLAAAIFFLPASPACLAGEISCTFPITYENTPTDTLTSGAIWQRSFSKKSISYNSTPVFLNDSLYIVNENVLFELDTTNGNTKRSLTLSATSNSVCYIAKHDNVLYIPLDGGYIECVDTVSMKSCWTSEPKGGQSLSHITCQDEKIYAGTTIQPSSSTTSGVFYCLDAKTGETLWTYENTVNPGGYYWSGSYICGKYLYFTGDNKTLVCHSTDSDLVYETYDLSTNGKIRTDFFYDNKSESLYVASNDGKLHKITLYEDGAVKDIKTAYIHTGKINSANCTSTPVVRNGRLYIGNMVNGKGYLSVLDATTLKPVYHVCTGSYKEVKATPLVSSNSASGKNIIYFTCNAVPGNLYYIEDSKTSSSAALQTLFTPDKKQYCIASVYAGPDGTLYYSNDSGYLFAIRENVKERVINIPSVLSLKNVSKKKLTKKSRKNYKMYEIKIKKNESDVKTSLEICYNKGRWKYLSKNIPSTYYLKIKKGQNIKLRFRNCFITKDNKKLYSDYTKLTKKS